MPFLALHRLTTRPALISSLHKPHASLDRSIYNILARPLSSTAPTFARRRRLNPKKRWTRMQQQMWRWLNGPGAVFKTPYRGSTNYLSAYDPEGKRRSGTEAAAEEEDGETPDVRAARRPLQKPEERRPFPLNDLFTSEPVLSEELRDEIYRRVVEKGQTVRQVSQDLSVTMERVGAVVRLKRVELDWIREGQPLARPYARALQAMLPQTPLRQRDSQTDSEKDSKSKSRPHESINDLPVHRSTLPQLFHPVPETTPFTRVDAGRVFHESLLPADARIPHPDLLETIREETAPMGPGARLRAKKERWTAEVQKREEARQRKAKREEERLTVVPGRRWDFVFGKVRVENAGKDGRGKSAVGWRYGYPLPDRKKGMVKIPTEVPD